jgi:hypothetical protein
MSLPRRLDHGMISLSSHASDGTAEATWLWRNIGADDHANVTPGLIFT